MIFHQFWWHFQWVNCHQFWWLKTHQFLQITKIFTKLGDNFGENSIENSNHQNFHQNWWKSWQKFNRKWMWSPTSLIVMLDILNCSISSNICGSKTNLVGFSHLADKLIIFSCSLFCFRWRLLLFSHWLVVDHHPPPELPLIWINMSLVRVHYVQSVGFLVWPWTLNKSHASCFLLLLLIY